MSKSTFIITFLIFISFIGYLNAQEDDRWIYLTSEDDKNREWYYDRTTITNSDTENSIWVKIVLKSNKEIEGKLVDYMLSKLEFFCGDQEYKAVSNIIYYKDGSNDSYNDEFETDSFPLNSIFGLLYGIVCENERWILFGSSEEDKLKWYYDRIFITNSRDTINVWVKTEFLHEDKINDKLIDYALTNFEIICYEQEFRMLDVIYYFKDGTSKEYPGEDYHYSPHPESMGGLLFNKICK